MKNRNNHSLALAKSIAEAYEQLISSSDTGLIAEKRERIEKKHKTYVTIYNNILKAQPQEELHEWADSAEESLKAL